MGIPPHAVKIFLPSLGDLLRGTLAADVNALSLLRVAHRFDMPPLEEMCQGILIDGIKVGTVAEILEVADLLAFNEEIIAARGARSSSDS